MRTKPLTFILILLLSLPLFVNLNLPAKAVFSSKSGVFVGVDVAYESILSTEQTIDKVSSYTNVFILGCSGNYNLTRLTILCQYVYDKGLSFIVYTDSGRYPSKQWFTNATALWGEKFQGIYFSDEEGGRVLDQQQYPAITSADNYSDAANKFTNYVSSWLHGNRSITARGFAYPNQYGLFTSDYGLYWYDYKAGYDTVFAEFAANYSRQLNVALCRGAATAYNKDWGVMITWTYRQPPYIESGADLYRDMVLAYQNGAKYIIIFDTNKDYSQTILQQEHLDAMKQFWQYVQNNPRTITPTSSRTAYVLPTDYGYGFRGPNDSVWGLWKPDDLTGDICMNISSLLTNFGEKMDIIYPDGPSPIQSLGYQNVLTWNDQQLANKTTASQNSQTQQSTTLSDPEKGITQSEFNILVVAAVIIVFVLGLAAVLKYKKKNELVNR